MKGPSSDQSPPPLVQRMGITQDTGVAFDPYVAWLQVRESSRPLNPYQLLGLEFLESDQSKLRSAMTRQRARLEARQDNADPQLWNNVHAELEEAIATLLDPDRKSLLDATLKRQKKIHAGSRGDGAPSAPHGSSQAAVACRNCKSSNPSQRRFCADCGAPLFGRCPSCQTEMAASERFCGSCGINIEEVVDRQLAEVKAKIRQATELQANLRFEEAGSLLRQVAVNEDARFESLANQSLQMLEQFAEDRLALEHEARECVAQACQHLERHAYDQALEELSRIPEPLHTEQSRSLLADAQYKKSELTQVTAEIREALAQKRSLDLLPKIERLLALKPDHAQGRELAGRVRDQICQAASKKLATHDYAAARTLLEGIPSFVWNDAVEQLKDKVRELDALATELRHASLSDDILFALAERLLTAAPGDDRAKRRLVELKKRRAASAAAGYSESSPQATPQRSPLFGLPVAPLARLARCEVAPPAQAVLRDASGQFFVALGLALQAKGQADISLNLMPAVKSSGLFGGVSLSLRKARPKGAWGVDLSSTGLRAIKLAADAGDGPVQIEKAIWIPHAKPLSQIDDGIAKREVLSTSLEAFREQHPMVADKASESVVIGLAGSRTLGRFFNLPPVAAKKLPDLVQFEAKHQIPIPLSELNWGYEVLGDTEGKAADEAVRHVLLLAARDFHINERLNLFNKAGIPVEGVAAEPLALHNAIAYELLNTTTEGARSIAVIDIGAEGSNFVVSSKNSVWFRSSSVGGNEFTEALVRQFQFTHSQAESLKISPQQARRFYEFQDALQPVLVTFGSEIERSLGFFAKQSPECRIERLWMTGGGAATPGLLRYLVQGH